MIVLDFADSSQTWFATFADMDGKYSDSKSPPLSPPAADLPESDSARSTPEAGAEPTGAIPKSRSMGKLNAFRSSLRDVGKGSSFKIGRKKQDGSTPESTTGTKEEKKKSKKTKKKDTAALTKTALSPESVANVGALDESPVLTSLRSSESAESLPAKAPKVSKASSLVRKLSIGRYRDRGKNLQQGSPGTKALSPSSTSPELSPAASRTDVSDVEDAPSVTSSTSESRQGPEGDDGGRPPSTGERLSTPSDTASPPLSPPSATQPPPPATELGQSRLIGGSVYKGLSDQSQTPSSRGTSATVASSTATASAGVAARQPLENTAPRKDRDPALETVPEDRADEERSQANTAESERSPPATPDFQSAFTSLDEAAPPHETLAGLGSSRAATAAYMSQRLGTSASPAADAAATKSQILSITTPALKKQQAFEETRAATAAAADAKSAAASAARPAPAKVPLPDDLEDDQFGDVDDDDASASAQAPVMSAPPPSAAVVMAEARARLSQSLGGSTDATAQPVNEKREHLYKILVIGELGTGKTSIIKRYVHQFFSQHYRATIGVDFALKVLNWDANTVIRLQLWDIAGQERFGNMTRVYYKEAVGAFIVFDVTRAATFDAVIKWKQDLDAKVQLADGSPIPCVLLANKCDQQKEGIVNNASRMDEYCREKGFSAWFETSAKENINIEDAARCLVTKILQNDKLIHNDNGKDNDKFALDGKAQKDEKSGGKSCAC